MKSIILSILAMAVLIGGVVLITREVSRSDTNTNNNSVANNVSIVEGKQIIEVKAKGGYLPRKSVAKAGIPTVLRFNTNGTFDCSSAVRIPSMGLSKNLPSTGSTDVELGNPKSGTLQGTCGMGMYQFEIDFQG